MKRVIASIAAGALLPVAGWVFGWDGGRGFFSGLIFCYAVFVAWLVYDVMGCAEDDE